jgi:hypothetical protein
MIGSEEDMRVKQRINVDGFTEQALANVLGRSDELRTL